mgnify:CR=1 FL=1
MNIKKMKLPILIIAIGMIVSVLICLLTGIVKEPVIKEHDFAYSVTYKLDGEVKTFDGVLKCSFKGHDQHDDPTSREYVGEYVAHLAHLGCGYGAQLRQWRYDRWSSGACYRADSPCKDYD